MLKIGGDSNLGWGWVGSGLLKKSWFQGWVGKTILLCGGDCWGDMLSALFPSLFCLAYNKLSICKGGMRVFKERG